MDQQLTSTVLMVRPACFYMNSLTAVNNHFQVNDGSQPHRIHEQALKEFDSLVEKLRVQGVKVVVVQDPGLVDTPDSIFPNNWISFHPKHQYNLYPMYAENRRLQRKIDVFSVLEANGIIPKLLNDYSGHEKQQRYLEGTGSMVLDRVNKVAYVALSSRSSQQLAYKFCQDHGYRPCLFRAYHTVKGKREVIYHTNVMMWVGDKICGICLQSIDDQSQKQKVRESILSSGLQMLELSQQQIDNFAGNALMLQGQQKIIVMSNRAWNSLFQSQKELIPAKVVRVDVEAIEKYGGGGTRCMIAEIF